MTEQQQPPTMRPPLRRSKDDRVFAGVCAGLARTLGIDPIIVRVLVAAFTLAGGAGLFAYIIAWILIPDDNGASVVENTRGSGSKAGKFVLAIVLAAAGLAIVSSVSPGGNDAFGFFLFVLIAVVVWQAFGHDWFRRTSVTHTSTPNVSGVTVEHGEDGQTVTVTTPAGETVIRQEPKSILGRIVWNLLVILGGTYIALDWAGVLSLDANMMFAIALAIVGLALVLSAFAGRARGLIALGIVTALLALPANAHVDTSTGDAMWRPISIEMAQSEYDLGAGNATLDLSVLAPHLQATDEVTVRAHVSMGELIVILPPDANVRGTVHAAVNVGSIDPGPYGSAPVQGVGHPSMGWSYGPPTGGPIINIDASVAVGQILFQQAQASVNA